MPRNNYTSLLEGSPFGDEGVELTEVPALENSDSPHGLPDGDTTSLPNAPLRRVMTKLIPTRRATSRLNYKALNTQESSGKYGKTDAQQTFFTKPPGLNDWTGFTYPTLFWDVLLTIAPVTYLFFAIIARILDKQPLSEFGARIQKGIAFGPTIFPIMFAAVVARLMRGLALRCATRGAHLGLLEQLTGSLSLASAVERTVFLRRFDISAFMIILLWLLSPLGGQSSLRILDVTTMANVTQGQIYYFNTTSGVDYTSSFSSADDYVSFLITTVLGASFMESETVQNSPVDQWNNVKIPRLNELSPFTDAVPGNPWISVDQTSHKPWSSLTGIMIGGIPPSGMSKLTLESSYLELSCPDGDHNDRDFSLSDSYKKFFRSGLQFRNISAPFTYVRDEHATSSFFLDSRSRHFSHESEPEQDYINTPVNLLYASNLCNHLQLDLFNCSIGTARVESDITCHGTSCIVNRMRRSEIYTKPPFSMPFNKVEFRNMLNDLPFAMGVLHDAVVSPIDQYLLGSNTPLTAGFKPIATNFSGVPGKVFSDRLTATWNTVWQASMAKGSIALGAGANFSANFSADSNYEASFPSASSKATITHEIPVYAANHLFIANLLAITLILQVCAIAGHYLKYRATAPDILGYVSAMTIENPHMHVPPEANTLDGLERARYLQKMKVQLADVDQDQVEGHLASGTLNETMQSANFPATDCTLHGPCTEYQRLPLQRIEDHCAEWHLTEMRGGRKHIRGTL